MDFGRIARSVAGEKPLTPEEERRLGLANVYIMDVEMDGGTVPADIQDLSDRSRFITPTEARRVIQWARERAPGNFWD